MINISKGGLLGSILIAGICALAATSAHAATTTTTFPVTATVLPSCLVTANPLAFGNYDPTATTPLDGTATLSVLCTVGSSFTVGLSSGTASGATVTTRRMTNGGNTLSYALYQEAQRTNVWGNTPGTDTPLATTAPVSASTLTVYGRIPVNQNVPAAVYTDTITVTVSY